MSKVVRLSSNSRTSSSGSIQVPSRTSSSLSFSNERGRRARRRSTAASAGHFNRDPATLPRIRLSHHDLYDLDALADLNLPFLATLPEERKGQAQGQGRASGGRRQSTANASPSPSSQSAMAKRRRQRRVTEPAPFNITEMQPTERDRIHQRRVERLRMQRAAMDEISRKTRRAQAKLQEEKEAEKRQTDELVGARMHAQAGDWQTDKWRQADGD